MKPILLVILFSLSVGAWAKDKFYYGVFVNGEMCNSYSGSTSKNSFAELIIRATESRFEVSNIEIREIPSSRRYSSTQGNSFKCYIDFRGGSMDRCKRVSH